MSTSSTSRSDAPKSERPTVSALAEVLALLALFFVYAGDPPPAVNEAHYLVKAKNFWDPTFAAGDLFASSGKAHTTFYWTFGVLTQFVSLPATAWIGRLAGWLLLAIGLRRCGRSLGLPRFASLAVAVIWLVGIEYGNFAGEWVVGGIEAKVPAYGFVLIGISEIVRRKWSRGWVWFGMASAFHVLTGGWAVIAAMIAFAVTERWKRDADERSADEPLLPFFSSGLFIGGALSLLGLIPAIRLTLGATPEQSLEAAWIYSYVRIRHHLLPSDFPPHWFVRHGALIAGFGAIFQWTRYDASQRRLLWLGIGAIVIACGGLLVGALPAVAPELAAKLLRYYWFRLSDAIVPLVVAMLLAGMLFTGRPNTGPPNTGPPKSNARRLAAGVFAVAVALFAWSAIDRIRLSVPPSTSHRLLGIAVDADARAQRKSHADWIAVCNWIRLAMPPDEVFLTPRHQQTFKWYCGRAEVVNWKDVPQDAKSLLEWNERFDDVFPKRLGTVRLNSMRVPISYSKLREYRQRYGVRFMVVDNRIATDHLPLVKLYPSGSQTNSTYSVYELPND